MHCIITKLNIESLTVSIIEDIECDDSLDVCQNILFKNVEEDLIDTSLCSSIIDKMTFHIFQRGLLYGKTLKYIYQIIQFE